MHEITFLQDLAVVMIVTGVVTILFHRFKQPVVLGYILAGLIIGPHTPPFPLIRDQEGIRTLAELGVIMLMFALGLEFSLRKLKQVGAPALVAAVLEILLMVFVGYEIGRLFGWRTMDSIFLGAILSISSTTIIIKTLGDLGKNKEPFARLIFGILIIEDILGIAMIALLSGIAMTGSLSLGEVGRTLGKLAIFLVVVLVAGLITVPRLLGYVARFKRNEMLLITVLGLCFGVSLLAAKLGYSVALGAFIIGAVIGEAREIHRIEALIEPIRDMFSAVFFVAIGLLIDPLMLINYWLPILVITAAVVVGKVVTCSFGAFVGGNDSRTSLRVGMGLAQIGEFSFIIAALGVSLKVTSEFLYPIAVAVSVITTLLTPYLIRGSDGLVGWFDRAAPRSVVSNLQVYTQWVGQLGSQSDTSMFRKLVRRWCWQMLLNAALITAVFGTAVFLGRQPPAWLKKSGLEEQIIHSGIWLAAAVISLPMLIATFRKLQALGLLVADQKVPRTDAGERAAAIRSIVAQAIPVAGMAILGLYLLLLSSALLPPVGILLGLLVVVALVTWLLWRSSIKLYSKAQSALEEALQTTDTVILSKPVLRRDLLSEANLETVKISKGSAFAGKLIRELQLRSRTGASIVGIERNGTNLINPGPDEEILAGDRVLLLGSDEQLKAAREVMGQGRMTNDPPSPDFGAASK